MVAQAMVGCGTSVRRVATQMGVTEGALRYRLKKRVAGETTDGQGVKATALDGYEDAVAAILERLGDARGGRSAGAGAAGVRGAGAGPRVSGELPLGGAAPGAAIREAARTGLEAGEDAAGRDEWVRVGGGRVLLYFPVGVLSHSRARFGWVSRACGQLAWHTGHVELFRRYGGVPLWVRIDNLATVVSSGAGPTAVLNATYARFRPAVRVRGGPVPRGYWIGQGEGGPERAAVRDGYGALLRQSSPDLEALQAALDQRSANDVPRSRRGGGGGVGGGEAAAAVRTGHR